MTYRSEPGDHALVLQPASTFDSVLQSLEMLKQRVLVPGSVDVAVCRPNRTEDLALALDPLPLGRSRGHYLLGLFDFLDHCLFPLRHYCPLSRWAADLAAHGFSGWRVDQ